VAGPMPLPPDGEKVLEAIQHMSLEDQNRYRTDAAFKEKIENAIFKAKIDDALIGGYFMNEDQRTAARHMLDDIAKGKYPEGDFIDKIYMEGGKKETDEPQVIRYVEEEFKKNPGLYERISHPATAEDQALKNRLDTALHHALDDDEYAKWGKPVLEHGRLTIEEKLDIDKEKGDKKSTFTDIQNLASA